MSGGVDSSVAAFLIKEKGYETAGITLRLYNNEDINMSSTKVCCSSDDIEDARSVANSLGIPYYVMNFRDNFEREVVERFVRAYECGATPNPCIDCNRYIKFGELHKRAAQLQFDYIVTGHYARIERDGPAGRLLLKKSLDLSKDQSYVLYSLTQEQLGSTLLPLGEMTKDEVRLIAQENGFINAGKHDSQDICFVPDGDYASFIEHYTGKSYPKGQFVDHDGNVLGTHRGLIRYTIGQRKGLGIAHETPLYVCSKSIEKNTVQLGSNEELFTKTLDADSINLIAVARIEGSMRVKAKVRYRHNEQPATVFQTGGDSFHLEFDEPQRAITSGQAVVLYDDDVVIGGGTIK